MGMKRSSSAIDVFGCGFYLLYATVCLGLTIAFYVVVVHFVLKFW